MFLISVIAVSVGAGIIDGIAKNQNCAGANVWNTSAGMCYTTAGAQNVSANSYAQNVSSGGLQGMGTFGNYFPTIALVLAASILIGMLITSFMLGGRN